MKPRILVTTGTGRTGSVAALELVRQGFPVRCLVHRDDDRAAQLRKAGIEVVVGNLHDWRDVRTALVDVQRAYHCPPFDPRHLHGAAMFALAAEQAGVEVVALMSGWNPHPSHPSILQREHWVANNLYRRQSFDVIHVNPGLFGWTYFLGLPAVAHFGLLALPFGEGLNAPRPTRTSAGSRPGFWPTRRPTWAGAFARPARSSSRRTTPPPRWPACSNGRCAIATSRPRCSSKRLGRKGSRPSR